MKGVYKKITLWHYLLTTVFLLVFPLIVIIIIPVVLCNDLLFGSNKGWNYNYALFAKCFEYPFFLIGCKNKQYYEYDHDAKKKYVFVLNHTSFFDIPEMLIGIKQPIRVLAKTGPDKIPVFGYYYRKSTVLVDRESVESRVKSIMLLKKYLEQGISIVVFPEGTFNQTNKPLKEFYDGAFKLAIETQTNIKPIILLDTYNRFHYSSYGIENGLSRMVYLQEISVQGLTKADVNNLKQQVYNCMQEALIRYKAPWIGKEYLN